MKQKLRSSGTGALSEAQEETAASISSFKKGVTSDEVWAGDRCLKFRFSKVGLFECFSVKMFLKYSVAAFMISFGFSTTTPFLEMDSILFFLFRTDARVWK